MGGFKLNTIERQYAAEARDRAAVERLVRETGQRNRVRESGRDFRDVLRTDMGAAFNFRHSWAFGPRRFTTVDHAMSRLVCACGKLATVKVGGIWRCHAGCCLEDVLRRRIAAMEAAA